MGVIAALGKALAAWICLTWPGSSSGSGAKAGVHSVSVENNGLLTVSTLSKLHRHFDLDGDGRVPLTELLDFAWSMRHVVARREVPHLLNEVDESRDGKLSLQEVLAQVDLVGGSDAIEQSHIRARRQAETQKFERADVDGNGHLDEEEAVAYFFPETQDDVLELVAQARLRARDQDGDGALSPGEFWEWDASPNDSSPLTREELADFSGLDSNGDGQLQLPELLAWESGEFHTSEAMRALLDASDSDGDGSLSAAELLAARESVAAGDAQHLFLEWAEHLEL